MITSLNLERVGLTTSPSNESYFVSREQGALAVKGLLVSLRNDFHITRFSYDGFVFHNQANPKNGHGKTTLATIDEAPLAVGGESPNTNKAEILDISSNTWTEIAEYPYHS